MPAPMPRLALPAFPPVLALLAGLGLAPALAAAATPGPALDAPVRITGAVALPAGGPAAVRIELHPAWEETTAALRRLAGERLAGPTAGPPPLASTRPDAAGRFELTAPGAGAYRVEVSSAGSLPMALQLPSLVEDVELPPLALAAASPLQVDAAGPDGRSAAGIEVRAETDLRYLAMQELEIPAWRPAARTGRTGTDGRVTLPRGAGEKVLLTVLTPARLVAEPQPVAAGAGGARSQVRLAVPGPRPLVLAAVDPEGRPAAGALVRLARTGEPLGVTGPDGRLEVAAPLEQEAGLRLEDRQGRLAEVTLRPAQAGSGAPIEVRLEEPVVIRGRVLTAGGAGGAPHGTATTDHAAGEGSAAGARQAGRTTGAATAAGASPPGRPLAGALVTPREPWGRLGAPVRSAADGTFELRLPRGQAARLDAAAAGHLALRDQSIRAAKARPAGGGTAELLLRPAAALAGEVVDAAGRPVAGALLWTPLTWGSAASARSGRYGRFRLAGLLPGGVYPLTVTHPSFPRTTASLRTAAAGRAAAPARIVLGAGRAVVGRVVDGAGRPLPGAELILRRPLVSDEAWRELPADVEAPRRAAADAAGRFRLPGLTGRYDLTVRRRGSAPLELPVEVGPGVGEIGDVGDIRDLGDVDLGDLTLEPGRTLEGRVVDTRGEPLAGAEVAWTLFGPGGSYLREDPDAHGTTGGDGLFRIADLAAGRHLDLTVHHPAHAPRKLLQLAMPEPDAEPLEIVLAPARVLAGRVVDGRGAGVPGAQLYRSRMNLSVFGGRSGGHDRLGATDAEGRFRLAGLAPGYLDLQVVAEGYRTRDVEGLQVAADRDLEGVEVVLLRGATLEGRVTTGDGEPAAGLVVQVQGESRLFGRRRPGTPPRPYRPSQRSAHTDAEGRYRVDGLEPDRYTVQAKAEGRGEAQARLEIGELGEVGETHLDLVLKEGRGVTVAGRVVDEDGGPVPGAEVRLAAGDRRNGSMQLGGASLPDGSFRLTGVAAGTYRLTAGGPGLLDPEPDRQVQVAGAPVEGIELRVARSAGLTVTGRLLGLTPEEARWVRVDAWQGFGRSLPGAVEAPDGYRVAGLDPGPWVVGAAHADGRHVESTIELTAETPQAVLDLEFPGAGFTLSGHAAADGRPLAGALVELAPSAPQVDAGRRQTRAGLDGRFVLRDLPAGRYRLFVLDEGSGVGTGLEVALDEDRTVAVEIATAPLRGRVLRSDGTPAEGAVVLLMGRHEALGGHLRVPAVRTDADGAFVLPRLAPGTYGATVEAEGLPLQNFDADVQPQSGGFVEVFLPPAAGPG